MSRTMVQNNQKVQSDIIDIDISDYVRNLQDTVSLTMFMEHVIRRIYLEHKSSVFILSNGAIMDIVDIHRAKKNSRKLSNKAIYQIALPTASSVQENLTISGYGKLYNTPTMENYETFMTELDRLMDSNASRVYLLNNVFKASRLSNSKVVLVTGCTYKEPFE